MMAATLSPSQYGANMVAVCRLYRNRYVEFMKNQLIHFQQTSEDLLNQMIDELESQEIPTQIRSSKGLTSGTIVPLTIERISPSDEVNLNASMSQSVDDRSHGQSGGVTMNSNVPTPPAVANSPCLTTPIAPTTSTISGCVNRQKLTLPSISTDGWSWKAEADVAISSVGTVNDAGSGVSSNDARSRPSESTVEVGNFDEEFIKQELENWSETDPCVSANTAAAAALFAESFDNNYGAITFPEHSTDLQTAVFDDDMANSVEVEVEVNDEMEEQAKYTPTKAIQIQVPKEGLRVHAVQQAERQQSHEDIEPQLHPAKTRVLSGQSLQPQAPPVLSPALPQVHDGENKPVLHPQHFRHVIIKHHPFLQQPEQLNDFELREGGSLSSIISSRPQLSYSCSRCHKPFRTSAQRDVHVRIHTGERPFVCSECSKSFRSSQSLAAHRLIHREERPYKCEICGRAFRQSSNLASHRLIHSGIRPHKCEICGKGFIKSSDLRRHSKVHDR